LTGAGTLDERYFEWLYKFVGQVRNKNPARSHWRLAEQLYIMEFTWFVHNDGNRIGDGVNLRFEFLEAEGLSPNDVPRQWIDEGCSILEMLIGLSRRAAFMADGDEYNWLWKMLDNLGLRVYTDDVYIPDVQNEVAWTFERIVNRTYEPDGSGGIFPLKHPTEDQRSVELWYQLSAYLLENGFG